MIVTPILSALMKSLPWDSPDASGQGFRCRGQRLIGGVFKEPFGVPFRVFLKPNEGLNVFPCLKVLSLLGV